MPEMSMIFQCSLEIPALSISAKSFRLVPIDVSMTFTSDLSVMPACVNAVRAPPENEEESGIGNWRALRADRLYGTGQSRISSLVRTCIDIGRVTVC